MSPYVGAPRFGTLSIVCIGRGNASTVSLACPHAYTVAAGMFELRGHITTFFGLRLRKFMHGRFYNTSLVSAAQIGE